MKQRLMGVVIALLLLGAPQMSRAQWVVFDPANLVQMIIDYVQTIKEYSDYVEEMKMFADQLDFDEDTLMAMLGNRGMGDLHMEQWDRGLRRYLPSPQSIDSYRSTCLTGMFIPEQHHEYCENLTDIILGAVVPTADDVFVPDMKYVPDDSAWAYERRLRHTEHSMAAALEAQRQSNERISTVESLVRALNADNYGDAKGVDLKRSVDLTGRIGAENALLAAETNRLLSQLLELKAHELHSTLGPEARERRLFHFSDQAFLDQWLLD